MLQRVAEFPQRASAMATIRWSHGEVVRYESLSSAEEISRTGASGGR
jgi:hypothetical protein